MFDRTRRLETRGSLEAAGIFRRLYGIRIGNHSMVRGFHVRLLYVRGGESMKLLVLVSFGILALVSVAGAVLHGISQFLERMP